MGNLLKLYGKLDRETVGLLGRFVLTALNAPNSSEWLKEKLRAALNVPPPVTVEVRSVPRK